MVLYAMHDALVKPMPGKAMAPSLAESWTQSKDGLVYEFVLRKNVRFHNGDVMTAEDVKFSFERYRGASATLLKGKVAKVEALDPHRVRFTLKQAWPDFLAFYATPATGAAWIVPRKYVEQVGDEGFKKAPVGAGPYKFVAFKPGVELVLEAHEQYWRKVPAVKTLVLRIIPDESTRLAALKRGEVDVAYSITGPLAEELKRTPGLTLAPTYFTVHHVARVHRPVGPEVALARPARAAGRQPRDRPRRHQQRGLPGPVQARRTRSFRRAWSTSGPRRPTPSTPGRPSSSWRRPATRTASTRGELTGDTIYGVAIGEPVANYLQQVGIRRPPPADGARRLLQGVRREEAARGDLQRQRGARQRPDAARAVRGRPAAATRTAPTPTWTASTPSRSTR